MIQVTELSKFYGDGAQRLTVLNRLSFTIEQGQTIALMGQSGCGKSTLLHSLAGFVRAEQGEIRINQQQLNQLTDKQLAQFRRQQLGVVFQQYNLIPSLTAGDNISFVRRLNGMSAHDDHCQQLIDQLGLKQKLNRYPHQLSGGEQQRVSIARAFVNRPLILLADEPTGNLDPNTAQEIMRLLDRINRTGTTVVMATHDQRIVDQMRRRVIALHAGQVVRDEQQGVYE